MSRRRPWWPVLMMAAVLMLGLAARAQDPPKPAEAPAPSPSPSPTQALPAWQEAAVRMSKLQAQLEYFYMETGTYPPSLAVLARFLNPPDLPKNAPRAVLPVDPATNKPFTYELTSNGRKYRLSAPDPSSYGDRAFSLESVEWGWMALLAQQRRFEQLALECKYNIEVLATQSEMFAKDNGGKFPAGVDALVPRYLPRVPGCPASGKEYVFTSNEKAYFIGCPNAEAHGLKKFGYSSDRGMQVEQLPAPPAGAAPPKPPAPAGGGQAP